MAIRDYVKIVLWLKPEEIDRLRRLLTKEADSGEVWALIMRKYITATIVGEVAQ